MGADRSTWQFPANEPNKLIGWSSDGSRLENKTPGAESGNMAASVYDPQNKAADTFARANHTGTQAATTITGLASVATTGDWNDLSNKPSFGTAALQETSAFATAAQGITADSAVQPGDLAPVATSGDYDDLSGKPTLGTAAGADAGDFATAAQGALAETALQSGDLGDLAAKDKVEISDIDATGTASSTTYLRGDGSWSTPAGGGGGGGGTVTSVAMTVPTGLSVSGSPVTSNGTLAITYASGYQGYTTTEASKLSGVASGATANDTDANLKNRANHTGTQTASTISDFSTAADARISAAIGVSVQAYNAKLAALAGLTGAADTGLYFTGTSTMATFTLSSVGRTLIGQSTQALMRTTGLGMSSDGSALVSAANYAAMRTALSLVVGTDVQAYDADTLKADTDDNLTAGFTTTAVNDGTKSSGTYTPTPTGGNLKRAVNGGAFTLAAPSATGDYTIIIQITNNGSAGAITLSGFSKTDGDSFTTTDGADFLVFITKINGFTHAHVSALQ